jgi:hypothetical protein
MIFKKILAFDFGEIKNGVWEAFYMAETVLINKIMPLAIFSDYRLYLWLITAFALFAVIFMKNTNERLAAFKPKAISVFVTAGLLIWCILSFSDVTTFIYIGF